MSAPAPDPLGRAPTAFALPSSLAELPAARPRPVQWRRLRDALAVLHSGDEARVLDAAYTVGDALGGMSDERCLRRLWHSEAGRVLLAARPCLPDALADFEALRALPEDTLGRHFLRFSERHGLDVRALLRSQHEMSRDYAGLDPLRRWLSDRMTVMHDLWHVICGYDATPAGESALMCFSLLQRVNDRALPIFVTMSMLTGKIGVRNAVEAVGRGRRARSLVEQPLEQLLSRPVSEVRRELRISPPHEAHPDVAVPDMLIPPHGG